MRRSCVENGGPFGGDIDVEGCVILRDPLPNAFDSRLFSIAEGGEIAISAEGNRRDECAAEGSVPGGVRDVRAAEIQEEHIGRARPAMKDQVRGEWAYRDSRFGRHRLRAGLIGCHRCEREVVGVINSALRIHFQSFEVRFGKMKSGQPLGGALLSGRGQAFDASSQTTGGEILQTLQSAWRKFTRTGARLLRGGNYGRQ